MGDYEQKERWVNQEDESVVPDSIKDFVVRLSEAVASRNVYEIGQLYNSDFARLTEQYYKASPWPSAEAMSEAADHDENFLVLYKELYFRHVHTRCEATVDNRLDSFVNYLALFDVLIGMNQEEPEMLLPSQWLWDIVDEFVYQFQGFHRFRTAVQELNADDAEALQEAHKESNGQVWAVQKVIAYLRALIKKGKAPEGQVASTFFVSMGQFALIGLMRVHVLMADYTSALQVLSDLDLSSKRSPFLAVPTCHTTLYYHLGFAYMMLRRYTDALKTTSYFLNYASRSALVSSDQIERMHAIVALAARLSGVSVDDGLKSQNHELFGDLMSGMARGEESAQRELFRLSSPKFVMPALPSFDGNRDASEEVYVQNEAMFMDEVRSRSNVADIDSYLRLCTSMSLERLATFLKTDVDSLSTTLVQLKNKSRQKRWQKGVSQLNGKWEDCSPVRFHVAQDMVHLAEQQQKTRFEETFIRNIMRCEDLMDTIRLVGSK